MFLFAHAAAPTALAQLTRNLGWVGEQPGALNLVSLVLVVAGFALLIWCLVLHFVHCPRIVEVNVFAPPYLLTTGPYRWSRNPMYVAGVTIWLGWTLFYGSVAVFLAMVAFWSAIAFLGVPNEERKLDAAFGERYRHYKHTVPRWLGRPRDETL